MTKRLFWFCLGAAAAVFGINDEELAKIFDNSRN